MSLTGLSPIKSDKSSLPWITVAAAGLGILSYALVTGYLLSSIVRGSLTETTWDRLIVVYNGIASVGFSCFGVLLGTSVQQVSLAEAKKESADKANTIKQAAATLQAVAQPVANPNDLGGGQPKVQAAIDILMRGLK